MQAIGMPAMGVKLVVLALAVCLVACGNDSSNAPTSTPTPALPQVSGAPPTLEALVGTWLNDGGPTPGLPHLRVRFSRDGTMAFDNEYGPMDDSPAIVGTYELTSSSTISFTSGDASPACGGGDTWAWRAAMPASDRLHTVVIEDGQCAPAIGTEWTWTRVTPQPTK